MPINVARSFGRETTMNRWDGFWDLAVATLVQTESYLASSAPRTVDQIAIQRRRLEDLSSQLASLADSLSPTSLAPWREQIVLSLSQLAEAEGVVAFNPNPMLIIPSTVQINGLARGRPRTEIHLNTVREVINQGYHLNEVIKHSNFSRSTLYRRRKEQGQLNWQTFTDEDIDLLVLLVLERHPRSGYRAVAATLKSEGITVTHRRIRDSLLRIDPTRRLPVSIRQLPSRIRYFVPSPNSVWHFDGHHKLIRWGFIVHGAIDGFSRRIMWLECRTNNRSETVLECFKKAIEQFGIPERTRCDKGGENVLVVEEMIRLHPDTIRPALTGKSTQNTRIERLWYDHGIKVGSRFKSIFYNLEDTGVLSHRGHEDWLVDRHCITRVFQWRIQEALNSFRRHWDYHPVRTANSKSPIRMWNDGWSHRSQYPDFPAVFPQGVLGGDDDNYASERVPQPQDPIERQVHLENPIEVNINAEVLETWALQCGADTPGDEAGITAYTSLRALIWEALSAESLT